jgi:hypothetical protein
MTKTPEQEANELVYMFKEVEMPLTCDMAYIGKSAAIQCAILHVERLIEVLGEMPGSHIEAGLKYVHYQQVLQILKDKK